MSDSLPLLPLVLDGVPATLARCLSQEGVSWVWNHEQLPGTPAGRFVLFDSHRSRPRLQAGQVPIDIAGVRRASRRDPFALLDDQQAARRGWIVEGHLVSEEVARVDKRAVRQQVLAAVRRQVQRAGGVWLRVGAFPFPYHSAFNLRLDHDEFDRAAFDQLLHVIAGHEEATSHYVCASAYVQHNEALHRLRGMHVGGHGWWHHTYRSEEENRRNVARGLEALVAAGLEPVGFVAPHGRFSDGLRQALETMQVDHSSEFGLAYDELPFAPADGTVLQVPVHPLCPESFFDAAEADGIGEPAAQTADRALRWFVQAVEERYAASEPIFLYGHPSRVLAEHPQIWRAVLDTVEDLPLLWRTTLAQFAAWWRARGDVRLRVTAEAGLLVVHVQSPPSAWPIALECVRGEHWARVPLRHPVTHLVTESLGFQRVAPRVPPGLLRVGPPQPMRHWVRRALDWERVTPLHEIHPHTWRHRVKRVLRRWLS